MKRRSVKSWTSKKSTGARTARSYKRTAQSGTRALALTRASRIPRTPTSMRFTRGSPGTELYTNSNTGASPTIVLATDVGGTSSQFSIGPANIQPGSAGGFQFGVGMQFKLSDVLKNVEFQNLFDHYSIDQVELEVSYLKNAANVTPTSGTSTASMPSVAYAPDFDDASVPLATDVLERQRVKNWTFRGDGQPLRIKLQPRTANLVYRDNAATTYIAYSARPGKSTILDLAYNDVPHYGLKMWFSDVLATAASTGVTGDSIFRFRLVYRLTMYDPK